MNIQSSRELIEYLQTNQLSPNQELCENQYRPMAMSTYYRPKRVKRNTTISIFSPYEEETQNIQSSKRIKMKKQFPALLRKIFNAIKFIDSLKSFSKQQLFTNTKNITIKKSFIPFSPYESIIICWKKLIDFLTLSSTIIYPIYIFYDVKDQLNELIFLFDLLFLFDITLNFFISYIDESNNIIQELSKIALNYSKNWLIIDIISSIPIFIPNNNFCYFFKILRLLKYFWNSKTITYQGQLQQVQLREDFIPQKELSLKTGTKYFLNTILNGLILIHVFGCLRHYINGDDFITNFYWATETLTTIGYGDIDSSYLLSSIWILVGVAYYSFTIGDFALLIQKSKLNQEAEILFLLERLENVQDMPDKLKLQCLSFIRNNLSQNPFWVYEFKMMVKEFPENIKKYLIISSMLDYCCQIPLLLLDINQTSILLQHIRVLIVEPGFCIYRDGQSSNEVFFLINGDVRILTQDKGLLLNILEGTIFGEFEAIEEKLRGTNCVAFRKSLCLVLPFRFLRIIMQNSPLLEFEIKQLHLRRRKLIINRFNEEKKNKLQYRRQSVQFFKHSFLSMTKEEHQINKQQEQILTIQKFNTLLLQKILGTKRQRIFQFLSKFRRSVQKIIEMNNLLDETFPDQWRELQVYQLIKRVFPIKYLKTKYDMISYSRKSSSVHSFQSSLSRKKYSSMSQQYFLQKLPEVKLKHIVISHEKIMKNKQFQTLQQIFDKYQQDPQGIEFKRKEKIDRSKWNTRFQEGSKTIILRIDQIEDSGIKQFSVSQNLTKIEHLWLKGSLLKFELFQQQRETPRSQQQ